MSEPFPDSLCHRCAALRKVNGANSIFLMCTVLEVKYPRQPVLQCHAHVPVKNDLLKRDD